MSASCASIPQGVVQNHTFKIQEISCIGIYFQGSLISPTAVVWKPKQMLVLTRIPSWWICCSVSAADSYDLWWECEHLVLMYCALHSQTIMISGDLR